MGFYVGQLAGGATFAIANRHHPGGNLSVRGGDPAEAAAVRARMADAMGRAGEEVVKPFQIQSAVVHEAADLSGRGRTPPGDAVVCRPGVRIIGLVLAADCLPIAVGGSGGGVVAVHAGWRGLLAGVLESAAETLRERGEEPVEAVVGPVIEACCYEFGEADLRLVTARLGSAVRGQTRGGTRALDLRIGASVALAEARVPLVRHVGGCTSCGDGWYSHRARREKGRHGLAVAAGPA